MIKEKYYKVLPPIVSNSLDICDLMDAYINRIRNNLIYKDEDYRAVFVGMPGAGKSVSALSLCWLVDHDFDMERCFFNPTKFIKFIKEKSKQSKKELKGKMILFDEAGVGMFSRTAQSKINKAVAIVSQTQRYLNAGIVYTLPSFNFLDKVVRKMIHQLYIMKKKILYPYKLFSHAIAEVYDIKINPVGLKDYSSDVVLGKPVVYVKNINKLFLLDTVKIYLPPKKLLNDYQMKKKEEMYSLYHKLTEELEEEFGDIQNLTEDKIRNILNIIIDDLYLFITKDGKLSASKIAKYFGINRYQAEHIITILNTKLRKLEKLHESSHEM